MSIEGLSIIQIVVRNRAGAAVPGLTVTILTMLADGSDGTAPTIYDASGVAITGPIVTDDDGSFAVWVAGGAYNIRATNGTVAAEWKGYRAGTAGACDVGLTAGRVMGVGPDGIPTLTGAQVGDVLTVAAGGVLAWQEPTGGGGGGDGGGSFDPSEMPFIDYRPNGSLIGVNTEPHSFASAKLRIESTIDGTTGPLTIYGIELRPTKGVDHPFATDTVLSSTTVSGMGFMTSGSPVVGNDAAIGYSAGPWEIEIDNVSTQELSTLAIRVPSAPQGDLGPMPGRIVLSIYDQVALTYVDVLSYTFTEWDYNLSRNSWREIDIEGVMMPVRVDVDAIVGSAVDEAVPAAVAQIEGMAAGLTATGLSSIEDGAMTAAAKFVMDLGPAVPPARHWRIKISKIVGGVDVAGAPAQSLRIWGLQLRPVADEDFDLPDGTTFESNLSNISNALENWGSTSNLSMNSTVLPIDAYISISYPEPMEFEEITFLVFQTGYNYQPGTFVVQSSVDGWTWTNVQTFEKIADDYPGGEFTSFPLPKSESVVAKVPAASVLGGYTSMPFEFSGRDLTASDAGACIVVNASSMSVFTITAAFAAAVPDGTKVTLLNFSPTTTIGFQVAAGSGMELNGSTDPFPIVGAYKAATLIKFSSFVWFAITGA